MIVDTNALSAWWDADPSILQVIESVSIVHIPVPALAEFRFGILQSTKRQTMETWVERALATVEILPVTEHTTHHYAEIRLALKVAGTPIPMNDLWISAIARQHGLPIVSRDTHFDVVDGIDRIGW